MGKFTVKDCDPDTGEPDSDEGYEDEYQLEDLEIGFGDFIQRVNKTNFRNAWEDLGEENELEDTYELSAMKSLPEAVKQILQHLGMQPCERSDKFQMERVLISSLCQVFTAEVLRCWLQ